MKNWLIGIGLFAGSLAFGASELFLRGANNAAQLIAPLDRISFKNQSHFIMGGGSNPSLVASTSAPTGSLFLSTLGNAYLKTDNGNTSNWVLLGGVSGGPIMSLTGDVTAVGPGAAPATVRYVGGAPAASVNATVERVNLATVASTGSRLVTRDADGGFNAGIVSVTNLIGNTQGSHIGSVTGGVTGNVVGNLVGSAASFGGSLFGDVTGTQLATSIANLAREKLAVSTGTGHVLINDQSGYIVGEATLAKSRGGSGQDNSSITFPSSGTLVTVVPLIYGVMTSGSGGLASVVSVLSANTGYVLTSNGSGANPSFQSVGYTPAIAQALHSTNCGWTTTSTSYVVATGDASCTFTQTLNVNLSLATTTDGTGNTSGIKFTPSEAAYYEVCASFPMNQNVAAKRAYAGLYYFANELANGELRTGDGDTNTNDPKNAEASITLCGIQFLPVEQATFTIRLATDTSGNSSVNGGTNLNAANWKVKKVGR